MSSSCIACADRRPSRAGFTLLEVLVTVGLVVVTLGLAALILSASAGSATRARLQAEQESELLRVASVLRHQMMAMASPSSTQTAVVSEAGQDPHSDTLDIVTAGLLHSRGVGRVEWRMIRNAGEEPYLAYREEPYLGGADPKKNPWIPFSRIVRGVEFRFWSSPAWVAGWRQTTLPERMRAIVYYESGEGLESLVVEAVPGVAQVVETSSSSSSTSGSKSSTSGTTSSTSGTTSSTSGKTSTTSGSTTSSSGSTSTTTSSGGIW